ncbi:hypothetical protein TNCV_582641 [Trichonephila clavipes]|nr:hypothetical protein TNCV_582641 [Trichonephila clavipes]
MKEKNEVEKLKGKKKTKQVKTSSKELFAVDDDNVYTAPTIMADKDILEFVQSLKDIIDADSDDENEMNKEAPVPTHVK